MPTYEDILAADLSLLRSVVDEWQPMHKRLHGVADKFFRNVYRNLNEHNMKGETATAAYEAMDIVQKELYNARDESDDIYNLLKDAYDQFESAQKRLRKLKDEIDADSTLTIDPQGRVDIAKHIKKEPGAGASLANTLTEWQSEVDKAVQQASDADRAASWALKRDADAKSKGFNPDGPRSIKAATRDRKEVLRDIKESIKIMESEEPSTTQLNELNSLMLQNSGDPLFAERLALTAGPRGTLEFWNHAVSPIPGSNDQAERRKILAGVQENLGITLATATQSNSIEMRAWEKSITQLGDDHFQQKTSTNSPYGFQLMSNLMRAGDFDDKFQRNYGKNLLEFETAQKRQGIGTEELWMRSRPQLNFQGKGDFGNDPMTGFMESLGHSPSAATDFFKSDFQMGGQSGADHSKSVFDYLVREGGADGKYEWTRDWHHDGDGFSGGKVAGHDSLGHALEAATTGYPYGASLEGETITDRRDADTAAVMMKVIDAYTEDDGLMNRQEGIGDSLGRMGSAYIDDVSYGVSDYFRDHDRTAAGVGKDEIRAQSPFPANYKGALDISHGDAVNFLGVLGRDEDAHSSLSVASRYYTTSLALDNPPIRDQFGNLHYGDATKIINVGAQTQGLLDQTRANQIVSDVAATVEERNKSLEKSAAWTEFTVSSATGLGVAFANPPVGAGVAAVALIPWVSETAAGFVNTLVGEELGEHNAVKEEKIANEEEKDEALKKYFDRGRRNAATPGNTYASIYDLTDKERSTMEGDFTVAKQSGYNWGNTEAGTIAPGPYEEEAEDKWFGIF